MKPEEARSVLVVLGAPERLKLHVELVSEAGETLLAVLEKYEAGVEGDLVRSGIILHDVGKVHHPGELAGPGNQHEAKGREVLLALGVEPRLAEICVTHASWDQATSLEELVVACADKLWKGKRISALEERLIREVATSAGLDYWDVHVELDTVFEEIADGGEERLERSRRPL